MKTLRVPILLLLLAFLSALAAPRVVAQEEEVSFDYFYDNLKPFGEWVQIADYGLCWRPSDVAEDWAPYTDGYWAYTDAGWTWVSYEDFGDIVYHYGRWVRVEDEGWCWVPDNDWGPAWVSWRNNEEYVGWAPLPPEAHFRPAVGISVWADETYDIGPGYYRFCHVHDFGAPVIREVCLPRSRNVVFFRETVNITNITINTGYGVPFCGGPRYDFVSARVSRPIPTLKLVRETNIINIRNVTNININGGGRRSAFASVQRGNSLLMPAPRIRVRDNRTAPVPNLTPARVVGANRVNRGWGDVKSPQDRDELRDVVRRQTKGATPETAPARAFSQAEVKAVPQKSDPDGPSPIGTARNRTPVLVRPPVNETVPGMPPASAVTAKQPKGRTGGTTSVDPADNPPRTVDNPGTVKPPVIKPPVTGTSKLPKGRTGTAVIEPADNPQRNIDNPVTNIPPAGKPPITGGSKLPKTRQGEGVVPVNPTNDNPITSVPPINRAPIQRVPAPVTQPVDVPRTTVPQRGPGGTAPIQPFRGGSDVVTPPTGPKRGATNYPPRTGPDAADVAEANRKAQAAAHQQQQASIAAQERAAAANEARQRAAAADDARDRAAAARQQQQAAVAAAARQRAQVVPQPQPQRLPQAVPQRPVVSQPPQAVPSSPDPRGKGKGKDKKDDDKR